MNSLLKSPSAWVPMAMSLAALSILLGFFLMYGVVHEEDESTAAHLWQILMALQIPIVLFFTARWLPVRPLEALSILALQAAFFLASLFPVFYFQL